MPKERLGLGISLMPMQKHSGNAAMIQDSVQRISDLLHSCSGSTGFLLRF